MVGERPPSMIVKPGPGSTPRRPDGFQDDDTVKGVMSKEHDKV
jgi:hypothetical protein